MCVEQSWLECATFCVLSGRSVSLPAQACGTHAGGGCSVDARRKGPHRCALYQVCITKRTTVAQQTRVAGSGKGCLTLEWPLQHSA